MNKKTLTLLVLVFVCCGASAVAASPPESAKAGEDKVKAAFLYNFAKFVDWPAEKLGDPNQPFVIGVVGDRDLARALEPLRNRKVKGRTLTIKYFPSSQEVTGRDGPGDTDPNSLRQQYSQCHLLYLGRAEKDFAKLLQLLKDHPVLTIGNTDGFLQAGGMINIFTEDKKMGFEVNLDSAKQAQIRIRAKLLKLARKVIHERKQAQDRRAEERQ